ncbi:30S ribosomal protein S17 [Candidatus Saccharibacteria bacterium]|nr:30S ribosomal protein S17 [Candidatus Saccharibacteria bacterium]
MSKTLTGIVTSNTRDKTITVTVTNRETHPVYKKQYTVNRKYQAHDVDNKANLGDKVTITPVRPVSKTKSFTLLSIDERSKGSIELKDNVTGTDLNEKGDLS